MSTTPYTKDRSKPSTSHQDTRKMCFKVGSIFHPCVCGSMDVFRSHEPGQTGWTLYCWTCSRKDEATGFHVKSQSRKAKPFLVFKRGVA